MTCAYIFTADYIRKRLQKAYEVQELATEELAALMAGVGPEHSMRWVQQGIQPSAPTPLDFKEKEQTYHQSVFILNRAHRTCLSKGLLSDVPKKFTVTCLVPNPDKAFEQLLSTEHNRTSTPDDAAFTLKKRKAVFMREGILLEGTL